MMQKKKNIYSVESDCSFKMTDFRRLTSWTILVITHHWLRASPSQAQAILYCIQVTQ